MSNANEPFEAQFNSAIAALRDRARKAGMSVSELCRRSGVSRTAVDRWERRPPKSVALVGQLQRAVREYEQEKADDANS